MKIINKHSICCSTIIILTSGAVRDIVRRAHAVQKILLCHHSRPSSGANQCIESRCCMPRPDGWQDGSLPGTVLALKSYGGVITCNSRCIILVVSETCNQILYFSLKLPARCNCKRNVALMVGSFELDISS